ncbi:MAG: lysophospholipase [Deltaproteobacteria bacterium]|nr:lysophospholipase [Deltaproteobacteria bacterium]MCL5879177.1 lysophospholipase [Deltaproteobacteria bacterium]
MTTTKEGIIKSKDNTEIFYKYILADKPKASVFIVHGLGEHLGRYDNVTNTLKEYNLFLLDLRGHGKSGGKRGHVMRFDEYLDDIDSLRNEVKGLIKGKTFILGHSMGGLIVLRYAIYRPEGISGVVASGPLLGVNVKVPKIKDVIGRLVANLAPGLSMSNEIDTGKLSHDKAVVDAYNNDPLVHAKVSARWYVEMVKAMEDTHENAGRLSMPCLILHGSADALTNPRSSREFFEKAGSKDKTYKLYEGYYHEVYNEVEKQKPLSDMAEWLNKRAQE